MLLIALTLLGVAWIGVVTIVVGVCVSAARGDGARMQADAAPATRALLRLIA